MYVDRNVSFRTGVKPKLLDRYCTRTTDPPNSLAPEVRLGRIAFGPKAIIFKTLKKRAFDQCVLPVMKYGCEIWALKKVNERYYRYTASEPTKEDLLLQSLCIPTQTEVRSQLGSKLADVFFENLSSEGRVILGLEPPLTAPEEVWIDPELRLKNRVRCRPVPEPHALHQKAFTHQVILELGERYVESLREKMAREAQEALKGQAAELEEECSKRLTAALEDARAEAEENCRQVVGTLMEHFDRCFLDVVEKSKLRMRKECRLRVQEERAEIAAYMLSQLQEEVEQRDLELCSDFYATLDGELNALAAKYVGQIDSERKVAREVVREVIRKYETMLADLKSEMEICSFVDICRAISEEKAKHEREAKEAEERSWNQTKSLVEMIAALERKNKTLQETAAERGKRIRECEKKMARLIQEFQKFVNFALKSAPAHAEYLLSMQKSAAEKCPVDAPPCPDGSEEFAISPTEKVPEGKATPPDSSKEDVSDDGRKTEEDAGTKCEREEDSKYSFNYYRFKYNLLKNLVKGIKFEPGHGARQETGPSTGEESGGEEPEHEESARESNEELERYRQELTLVGEDEKEHMGPAKTFLSRRMRALTELCRNDPAMARMMLGRAKIDPGRPNDQSL